MLRLLQSHKLTKILECVKNIPGQLLTAALQRRLQLYKRWGKDITMEEFKTKVTENTTLFAAYVMTDADAPAFGIDPDAQNFVRVWARYNFK